METQKAGIPPFYVCFDLRSGAWRVGLKTTMQLYALPNLTKLFIFYFLIILSGAAHIDVC